MATNPSDNPRTQYLETLNSTLDTFFTVDDLGGYRQRAGNGEGPLHTLVGVLTNLRSYLARMMALIESDRVVGSTKLPKAYARRTLIDRAAEDVEVILRALQQRMPPLSLNDALVQRLKLADRLAFAALKPVLSTEAGGLLSDEDAMLRPTTAVTYFQKANSIRVIPYAPVALIGIPFSAATCTQDLLAIPHEAGHYVYWHEPLARGSLNGSLARHFWDQPAWVSAWQEEIFADVYGTLVGGPYMALNFQDILADTRRERFVTDDGDHPVAVARAAVFTSTLRAIGYGDVADKIDAEWETVVRDTYGPTTEAVIGGQPVALALIREHLDTVVQRIVDFDLYHMRKPIAGTWSWDQPSSAPPEVDLARYKANFDAYLETLEGAMLQAHVKPDDDLALPFLEIGQELEVPVMRLVRPGVGELSKQKLGAIGGKLDDFLTRAEEDDRPLDPALWAQLLSSGGWTTGPGEISTSGK